MPSNPSNEAAAIILSAQSTINDLSMQINELSTAMSKQQAIIDSLISVAEWGDLPEEEPPHVDHGEPGTINDLINPLPPLED